MKYLKTWEMANNISVKIHTPKLANNRQYVYWYKDGAPIATVSDGHHEFEVSVDKIGNKTKESDLKSNKTDKDVKCDDDAFFRIDYYGIHGKDFANSDPSLDKESLTIGRADYYDDAIQVAKDELNNPSTMKEIAAWYSCECDKCKKIKIEDQFDL